MKIITRICLLIMALGVILGWFLFGGFWGSVGGLLLAGFVTVPLYCLAGVFARSTVPLWNDPLRDTPSSVPLDRSQLARGAYETRHGNMG